MRADHVFADQHLLVGRDENGDRVGARAVPEQGSLISVDRDLAGDVVDAELGQSLPNAARGRTPLGLPELVHG